MGNDSARRLRRVVEIGKARARALLREPAKGVVFGFQNRGQWAPMAYPPGHYYSPLPSLRDIAEHREVAGSLVGDLPAIDLRREAQIALMRDLEPLIATNPFVAEGDGRLRYSPANGWFPAFDAIVLNAMLRHLDPRRIVEVGSGWSSAALLDTYEERVLPEVTLVEPFPERLFDVLPESDHGRFKLLQRRLQDLPVRHFEALEAGDVLFVDSTHVSKLRSDVNFLLFEILPRLAVGVVVHLHDVFFPFEYPLDWLEEGRGWNEAYLVRAFLEFNDAFEIVLWNHFLRVSCQDLLGVEFPALAAVQGGSGSLWLRRRA